MSEMDRMIAKEFAALSTEDAQQAFIQQRIEFLEDMLEDLGSLKDSYAEENHFSGMSQTSNIIQGLEDELAAARQGFEAHVAWLNEWAEKKGV